MPPDPIAIRLTESDPPCTDMPVAEHTKHQKRIIDGYYRNLDGIMLARLQELVGELYLAESQKKRTQLWKRVRSAMVKLKIKDGLIEHIVGSGDPKLLATNLEEWLKAK